MAHVIWPDLTFNSNVRAYKDVWMGKKHIKSIEEKIFIYLGGTGGSSEYVLRSHLILEELLDILVRQKLENENSYAKARLSFSQKLCLLQSLYDQQIDSWVYLASKKLNSMRNSCAHVLEPEDINKKVCEFVHEAYEPDAAIELKISAYIDGLVKHGDQALVDMQEMHYTVTERFPSAVKRLLNSLIRHIDSTALT